MGIFTVLLLVILIFVFLRQKDKLDDSYWRGRLDGWQACESSVLKSAAEHPDYIEEKVLRDLIQ